jgi:hypothetical protein
MVRLSSVQAAVAPTRPAQKSSMNPVATGQWTGLFQDQGKQNGKKAHGKS